MQLSPAFPYTAECALANYCGHAQYGRKAPHMSGLLLLLRTIGGYSDLLKKNYGKVWGVDGPHSLTTTKAHSGKPRNPALTILFKTSYRTYLHTLTTQIQPKSKSAAMKPTGPCSSMSKAMVSDLILWRLTRR